MRVIRDYLWKAIGPVILSALSLFIGFFILQPIALALDPTFSLLASRGTGKVAFITMVIFQVVLLLSIQSKKFFNQFLKTNLYFFKDAKWLKTFFKYFVIFFFLHLLTFSTFYFAGYSFFVSTWGAWSFSLISRIGFGFFVAFLLAWTEELIFRGTLFPYFEQTFSQIGSVFITSFIFMIVHDLQQPWRLLTTNIKLGLGLFLLGLLLNLVFAVTRKLYVGMGIHAGIVAVKVFFRRVPCIKFVDSSLWSWWVHKDLRQSYLVHFLFLLSILIFGYVNRKKLLK
jgi:membrane protease YdiL (CAAX protease family)